MDSTSKAGNTPAPDLNRIADLVEKVILNQANRIMGQDALLMFNAVEELRAAACKHQNIEVCKFAADRFSCSCNDCGADVRSEA